MYGTYGFTEAKKRGRGGTPMAGTSRTPRARLGQAWHAGAGRLGTPHAASLPKLRPPIFNDLRAITSLSIRFGSLLGWAARRVPRPNFQLLGMNASGRARVRAACRGYCVLISKWCVANKRVRWHLLPFVVRCGTRCAASSHFASLMTMISHFDLLFSHE